MNYADMIAEMREKWTGKRVRYNGGTYNVVSVDYNGALLIDKPAQFTDTTAITPHMVETIQ